MCFSKDVGRSKNLGEGGACCNVVCITVPLVEIGLAGGFSVGRFDYNGA